MSKCYKKMLLSTFAFALMASTGTARQMERETRELRDTRPESIRLATIERGSRELRDTRIRFERIGIQTPESYTRLS